MNEIIKEFEKLIEEIADCFSGDNLSYHTGKIRTILYQYTNSKLKKQLEEMKNWVFKNHDHHEFADEEVIPLGVMGCIDNDFPYVNSIELEKFIDQKLNNLK